MKLVGKTKLDMYLLILHVVQEIYVGITAHNDLPRLRIASCICCGVNVDDWHSSPRMSYFFQFLADVVQRKSVFLENSPEPLTI